MVFSFNYIVVNKLLYSSSFVLYIANIINIIKDKSHDCKTCAEMGFFMYITIFYTIKDRFMVYKG